MQINELDGKVIAVWGLGREGWKRLGRYKMKVQDLNGSDKREPEDF